MSLLLISWEWCFELENEINRDRLFPIGFQCKSYHLYRSVFRYDSIFSILRHRLTYLLRCDVLFYQNVHPPRLFRAIFYWVFQVTIAIKGRTQMIRHQKQPMATVSRYQSERLHMVLKLLQFGLFRKKEKTREHKKGKLDNEKIKIYVRKEKISYYPSLMMHLIQHYAQESEIVPL